MYISLIFLIMDMLVHLTDRSSLRVQECQTNTHTHTHTKTRHFPSHNSFRCQLLL